MDTIENTSTVQDTSTLNRLLSKSFGWMALGLFVSFVVSLVVALSPALVNLILRSDFGFLAMILIELGCVWYLSSRVMTLSVAKGRELFLLYAIVSGTTLSVIFFAFNVSSIITIFFATSAMFGLLALYGARTKKDLSGIGHLASFGLIGLLLALVASLFIGNGMLDLILSWVGVIIFTILISYDVQKIKKIGADIEGEGNISRASILGALTLYLDFINLFLFVLRIFGRRR